MMEKTEPLIMIWECVRCKHTEFRDGAGPHWCTKRRQRRNLFNDKTHVESCGGRMVICRSTGTDARNVMTKSR